MPVWASGEALKWSLSWRIRHSSTYPVKEGAEKPIHRVMLWLSHGTSPDKQVMGIHCQAQDGAYVLILISPDGSQEAKTFTDEDAMFEAAMKIHCALATRGWRVCPEPRPHARAS